MYTQVGCHEHWVSIDVVRCCRAPVAALHVGVRDIQRGAGAVAELSAARIAPDDAVGQGRDARSNGVYARDGPGGVAGRVVCNRAVRGGAGTVEVDGGRRTIRCGIIDENTIDEG